MMDCHDVQRILNDAVRASLNVTERDDLRAHLDACLGCYGEWQSQELIAALPISPASSDLLTLARHALHAHASGSRRAGMPRSLIVGCVLLASAAAAVLIGQSLEPVVEADVAIEESPMNSEPIDAAPAEAAELESASAAVLVDSSDSDQSSRDPAPTINLDRSWVVVLPFRPDAASAEVMAVANERRDMLMRRIEETDGLNLADPRLVQIYFDGGMTDADIGKVLGAGVVIINSIARPSVARGSGALEISFAKLDPVTDRLMSGTSYIYRENQEDAAIADVQRFDFENEFLWDNNLAAILDMIVREATPESSPSREQLVAENQTALLDASLSDDERVSALEFFRGVQSPGRIVVDAGIGMLANSVDPEVRRRALVALIEANDPGLVPPLLRTLAYDPSPEVRLEAAAALAKFSGDSSVRDALALAEANDAAQTVRDAAAFSMLSEPERLALRRATFFNENLPVLERVWQLNIGFIDPRKGPPLPMDNEVGRELVDIAVKSPDPNERAMAFTQLFYVGEVHPEFRMDRELRKPLLEVLEHDPAPNMRGSAAHALRLFVDQADVREALEYARDNDPDRLIRNAARTALEVGQ